MSKKNEVRGKHAANAHKAEDKTTAKAVPAAEEQETVRMNPVGADSPSEVPDPQATQVMEVPIAGGGDGAVPDAAAVTPAWEPTEPKKSHTKRNVGIALGIVAAVLVAVYVAGGVLFTDHFYPGTTLNGEDISLQSTDEVAQRLNDIASNYSLEVEGNGVDFTVSSDDMGLQVDGAQIASDAIAQNNPWSWPAEIVQPHDISETLISAYNSSGLEEAVNGYIEEWNESAEDPVNASLAYDEETNSYNITPEQAGTKIDAQAALEVIDQAIMDMQSTVELTDDQMQKPTVYSDDEALLAAQETANKYVQADLNMILGEDNVGEINSDQISQWVTIDGDANVTFDEDAMDSWLTDYGNGFDTVGTQRTYTRPDGKQVTVEGGTFGREVDTAALVEQVREDIMNGTQGDFIIPLANSDLANSSGVTYGADDGVDWSDYIDVDLSEQHAYYYTGSGELKWESDVITGIPDGEHDTPTGVWTLFNKESPSVLKGDIQESTGAPEYETEVSYWMPFTYSGCGLHDATWQPSFGGSMYSQGYGSHGCVNLPLDAAKSLYDIVEIGIPVVVHW